MFIQPYQPHELVFAYCYRVYIRFRTHRCRAQPELASLKRYQLNLLMQPYNVRVLSLACSSRDVLAVLSLQPSESISSAAGKLKGRVSKWLGRRLGLSEKSTQLSKGYFACTVGKSRRHVVENYLSKQAEHHGYANRQLPPVFVKQFDLKLHDIERISPKHAFVVSQFHIVLSTSRRIGVLGSRASERVALEWLCLQEEMRIALIKVSFVPDHVHVALRAHPALSLVEIVLGLMNAAQEVISQELVVAGLDRLWGCAVYVSSYGDLSSAQIIKYIERWEREKD